MADIKKQFSLDYLVGHREATDQQGDVGSQALEEAVLVYSDPIFKALSAAQNQQMRMHELVPTVNDVKRIPSFEEFAQVINHLERLKFVEITEREITGNHLVHLLGKP